MSEAEGDLVELLVLAAGVLVVLVGVANYVGTDCTALFGKVYDGAILVGDSLTAVGLVGGVVAFAANRFLVSRKRRATQPGRPRSDPSAARSLAGGEGPTRSDEERRWSGRSLTFLATKWFSGLLLLGIIVTLAGWWMVNTSDFQCASGFWSGFLSGRIPP